ncbi:MAG: hypothetical protein LGR52_09505 [Candidatus Thiosymbion ectosymbiont of Robbea hypermnestra]|nr:hypothetical protein [Candidatus Thiosymbion ectosymbiont of Robbea hypermnestra]
MGAVKSSPELRLSDPDRLVARYGGVPVIYVESDEDRYVYGECWFKDWLSRVEFQPAMAQCGFSGCSAVIEAVGGERAAGNLAWGIVDRDTVMSRDIWCLVHETDDTKYESVEPFGTEIKVLCRWEMESYLADAIALEQCRAELKRQPRRSDSIVAQELLDQCDALVPHAAINATCHELRVRGSGDGYTDRFPTRSAVEADVQSKLLPNLPDPAGALYAKHVPLVEAFDKSGSPPGERVDALLRRVDGKGFLSRFGFIHNITVDLKGLLANRIKEQARIPSEIRDFVAKIANI